MNEHQSTLLNLAGSQDLGKLSLRQMAELIGAAGKPQIVKHHLLQLDKKGLLRVNLDEGIVEVVKRGTADSSKRSSIFSLPIFGAANCGPATIYANDHIEGYLKVSSKILPHKKKGLFVLIASGNSMNKATIDGKTIEDGDYVIVDNDYRDPKTGDIVVSIIDGMANIKRYVGGENQVTLMPESSEKGHHPIFIHEDDDFLISGKVVGVIKKPR